MPYQRQISSHSHRTWVQVHSRNSFCAEKRLGPSRTSGLSTPVLLYIPDIKLVRKFEAEALIHVAQSQAKLHGRPPTFFCPVESILAILVTMVHPGLVYKLLQDTSNGAHVPVG